MKQFYFLVIFVCYSVSGNESCPVSDCSCDFASIVCRDLREPLNLTLFNNTVNKVIFENTIFKENIFTLDSEFQHLSELSFENCNLSMLNEDAFKRIKWLKYLRFFSGVDLENLKLDDVPLIDLDLVQCDLNDNNLAALEEIFNSIPTLERLDISDNEFTSIDAVMFSSLDSLKTLIVRGCDIKVIYPSELDTNLEEVNLSENKLADVPDAIFKSSRHSLAKLDLSENPLQQISLNFSAFSALTSLNLQGVKVNCSCGFMSGLPNKNVVEPSDLRCHDFQNDIDGSVDVVTFLAECPSQEEALPETEGSNKNLVIVIIFLVVVTLIAVVGCLVHRVLSNRRRRAQEKKAVRYSAVYRETVESSMPSSRTTVDTKA